MSFNLSIADKFDPYGPFTISQGRAFIKYHYVPVDIGSDDLSDIIKQKTEKLEQELRCWQELAEENERIKNESCSCDRGHTLSRNV